MDRGPRRKHERLDGSSRDHARFLAVLDCFDQELMADIPVRRCLRVGNGIELRAEHDLKFSRIAICEADVRDPDSAERLKRIVTARPSAAHFRGKSFESGIDDRPHEARFVLEILYAAAWLTPVRRETSRKFRPSTPTSAKSARVASSKAARRLPW